MTHTPGPWQIGGELISQEGSNLELASVWSKWAKRPRSPGLVEADANARLIAAAPELLELAKLWRACLNTNYLPATMESEYGAFIDSTLTKATGSR